MVDRRIPDRSKLIDRLFRTRVTRRGFAKLAAVGVGEGVAVAVGYGLGRRIEYEHQNPNSVTEEPLEIQIRKVELRGGQEGLKDEELRSLSTWLICSWYGFNHSFGAFSDPDNEYAATRRMYASTSFIEDEQDPRLQNRAPFAGSTVPGESIEINLTSPELKQAYLYNTTGGTITPLMQMRDTLTHELTHFITKERRDAEIIDLIKQTKPEFANIDDVAIRGFRIYFNPDPNDPESSVLEYLDDFDEAATELIANYSQRTAGLAVGLPTYPEGDQPEASQSKIEKTLDALEATLKLSGISMDHFAELHSQSDLDALAKAFADSTTLSFQTDFEKIQYGLSVIIALKELDRRYIGEHIQNIKA